jgi:TetR/AcrR family transcriptional regulator
MGIAERRGREKEQRRIDIIDAAERVFFSKGWRTATMDDVAESVELSKATLYLYFKNKEELYAAILVRGSVLLHEMFETAIQTHDTGIEQVRAIGRAYIAFHDRHRDYYDAMMYFESKDLDTCDDCTYAQQCDEYRDLVMGLVATGVRNGIDDGTLRSDLDPMKTAVLLWAQSSGVLRVVATDADKLREVHAIDPSDLMETFFDFVFHAIAANPDEVMARMNRKLDTEQS